MSAGLQSTDYFVAGGTLRSDAPSYVKRPTDDELFSLALGGKFCYVLTPRQMGKSSLMIRTAQRLHTEGIHTVVIDLTRIGTTIGEERWYLSLLSQLQRRLGLSTDPVTWWQSRSAEGYVPRFVGFLRDVVLVEVEGRIVIFIDEIDTTLNLDFRHDFFAAIRAIYNARADDPEFERLTFVLLGVASPTDLITGPERTPFNIGHGIELEEFSHQDASVLRKGLEATCPGQGEAIFSRIHHWTNGHPYLTQKLCLAVAESQKTHWTDEDVDQLVGELFISAETRRETNLQFVQDRILSHRLRRELLRLYKDVIRSRRIQDDSQSPVQTQLKLSGLVKVEQGALCARNKIYRRVFDLEWVRRHTEVNWTAIVAGVAATVAVLAVGLLLFILSSPQNVVNLDEGDVSPLDISAPRTLTYESKIVKEARERAAASIQDIYDPPDASVARQQEVRARQILDDMDTVRQDPYASPEEQASRIAAIPDLDLSPDVIEIILALDEGEWQELKDETVRVVVRAMQGEITESQVAHLRRALPTLISLAMSEDQASVVEAIAGDLVTANTFYNAARTEEARLQAQESFGPIAQTFRRGEIIVRNGDIVSDRDIEALDAYGLRQPQFPWQKVVGGVVLGVLLLVLVLLLFRVRPSLLGKVRHSVRSVGAGLRSERQ
jgi:hypothetical protein